MKMTKSILFGLISSSAFAMSIDALDGVLHTSSSKASTPYYLNMSLHSEFLPNQSIFQGDSVSNYWERKNVAYLDAMNHFVALGLGLPKGFGLSLALPIYNEEVQFDTSESTGWYIGDLRSRVQWTTPSFKKTPWLKTALSLGTSFPTSSLGEGYIPRELEYALPEAGCRLGTCGSRNTGVKVWNADLRAGLTIDFRQIPKSIPLDLHFNLGNRKTGLIESKIGPYKITENDFYDVMYWSVATEYALPWYALGIEGEYLNVARWSSDYDNSANQHDLSYGLSWKGTKDSLLKVKLGMTHGILNEGYARDDHALPNGEDTWEYHTKTPDYRIWANASYSMDLMPDSDKDGVKNFMDKCPRTPLGLKVDGLGCPLDADKDGVYDHEDQCPNTPEGRVVDAVGCELDADKDKVVDALDKCPGTPMGRVVDTTGCELDADQDKVVDGLDQCPETAMGRVVDSVGCELDADKDKVVDGLDQCPGTPLGHLVDAIGCEKDSDKDGVVDALDKCPNTLKGLKVDATGCPPKDRDLSQIAAGITFEKGSAKLKPSSYAVLDKLVAVLKEVKDVRIEIGGHTSRENPANDTSNLKLSQARTESVEKYLVSKGISEKRIDPKGYGVTRPIADNSTEEGRIKNRRVEITPIMEAK